VDDSVPPGVLKLVDFMANFVTLPTGHSGRLLSGAGGEHKHQEKRRNAAQAPG